MVSICPLCLRRHRGAGRYCSPPCEARAAVPTSNDLMVTTGRAALARSRAARGVEQSTAAQLFRNLDAYDGQT